MHLLLSVYCLHPHWIGNKPSLFQAGLHLKSGPHSLSIQQPGKIYQCWIYTERKSSQAFPSRDLPFSWLSAFPHPTQPQTISRPTPQTFFQTASFSHPCFKQYLSSFTFSPLFLVPDEYWACLYKHLVGVFWWLKDVRSHADVNLYWRRSVWQKVIQKRSEQHLTGSKLPQVRNWIPQPNVCCFSKSTSNKWEELEKLKKMGSPDEKFITHCFQSPTARSGMPL